jgi:hypothetical protein
MRSNPVSTRLFLGVLLMYSICPPFTSYDSYWTVPTALSILRHGSTILDEYAATAPPIAAYAAECSPDGHRPKLPAARPCGDGHMYNFYPIGVSVLALPTTLLMYLATGLFAAVFPNAHHLVEQPVISAFLAGDLFHGHALVELWTASTLGAITVLLQFKIYRRFVDQRAAVLLALLFAFGTSEFSIASRNLFQHGPSILCLSAALYLAIRALDRPAEIQYVSVPLALAFTIRPSNCVSVAILTVYVAVHYRAYLLRFVLWSLTVAAPFFAYNLATRHSLFQQYYGYASAGRMPPGPGMLMNLFSPSRGLLVFTPLALFTIVGMWLAWRHRWCLPLSRYLAAILIVHTLFVAFYWAGHSYGPRYFTDVSHLLVLFLVPAILQWRKMVGRGKSLASALFVFAACWSLFVHVHGATSWPAQQWSQFPVGVDQAPWRVWDWSDPQFLRGLR